ncbi:MFS transporter [Desulfitobacterium chlororespirans]|uniref:Predicted arabinose efflux permease, MFS family n=1 Tax=Desulfitobacterium chlororespirans DSM 11544 TaxID=1121395 RepID=A0A1M7SJF4_9FIRM|nr:MFS transporter [Desulfitobacterium chlororespirans]SHN58569.1 Predicted arabinose efflux permease, MFS family [Desulfitobacterium chlororespirans DSM 11544]
MLNPFQAVPNSKKIMTLAGIYIALLGQIFVSSGLSVILPAAARDIGGETLFPLASTISGLISIAAMPLFGYYGAKNPALKRTLIAFSVLVGALVSFSRAIAPSMEFIIFVSFFWGLVSAGIYVLGFSLIRDMYETEKAGFYLGLTGTMMSVSMLIGPTLTGILIQTVSWRAACHVVWPVLTLAAVLIFFGVNVSKEEAAPLAVPSMKQVDLVGAFGFLLFLGGIIMSLSLGPKSSTPSALEMPFGSLGNNIMIALAIAGLAVLIAMVKKKGDDAILPARVLKDRNTLCLTLINLFTNFSNMAVFFFIPTYVIYVMGKEATWGGLATTVYSVLGLFLAPVFGRMIAKARNARLVLNMGLSVRIVSTLALIFVLTPTTPLVTLYVIMFITGFYGAQQSAFISAAPQVQLAPQIRVQGNAVFQLAQNLGSGIGMAVYTMIIGMKGPAAGLPVAFMIAVGAAVVALVITQFLVPLKETVQTPKKTTLESASS